MGDYLTVVDVLAIHALLIDELGGDSMEHHRFIIGLMEAGNLDWQRVDAWLRSTVEES